MGGGSSKKYKSAASYQLEPTHNQPTMKTIAQRAKLTKRKFTQEELLAMYAIEDKLYQEKMKAKREREYRQEEAIRHTDSFLYYCAETTKRVAKYPKDAPNGKAGQKYLWIKLDHRKYNKDKLEESVNYPESVIVDREGNLFIAERAGDEPIMLTSTEILASRTTPPRPLAPTLVDRTTSSITVQWPMIKCCIDVWAFQWQRFGDIGEWKNITEMQKRTYGTLKGLKYAETVVFRVRSHNMVGWSDWGSCSEPFSTLPGPPSQPNMPEATRVGDTDVEIAWDKVVDNGESITRYIIRIKKADMPYDDFLPVHDGPPVRGLGNRVHRIADLDDGTTYYVQVAAVNAVGTSDFSYAAAFTTRTAPIEVVGTPLRTHGDWQEYWDDRRSRFIYYNASTGTKQKTTPYVMRKGIDDPNTLFRKRRYRLLRAVHTDSSAVVSAAHYDQSPHSPHSPTSLDSYSSPNVSSARGRRGSGHGFASPGSPTSVGSYGLPRPVIYVERRAIFESSLQSWRTLSQPALHMKWRVEFRGEDGIDSGGLTKEWFLELTKEMMSPARGLFVAREGGARLSGMFGLNPNMLQPSFLRRVGGVEELATRLQFCGAVFAKAIAERCMLGAKLDPILAQSIVGADFVETSIEALDKVDPTYAKSLRWILDNPVVPDEYGETLCASRADGSVVDFCPGGRNIDVDDNNKSIYVDGLVRFKMLDEMAPQRESFLRGFYSIVGEERIRGFDIQEFNLMLTGHPEFDVHEFSQGCRFEGAEFDADSPLVGWFWDILEEMSVEKRQSVLRFATGCPTVPLDGFDPEFTLVCNQELSPEALPRAHTCFNKLVLPPYTLHENGIDQLRKKLSIAIEHGVGFGLT